MTEKLAESKPRISQLSAHFDYNQSDIPSRCHSVFESLVKSCSGSLVKLKVSSPSPDRTLGTLSPLPNVTCLNLRSDLYQSYEFLHKFEIVRVGELFPKLEKFDLNLSNPHLIRFTPRIADHLYNAWSSTMGQDPLRSSVTATSLNLRMELCPMGSLLLKLVFPNASQLIISPGTGTAHAVPYEQIWKFWPNLKQLIINGPSQNDSTALPNCDEDFCGINKEELELLWGEKEEYLGKVHIVPVHPSSATMKSKQRTRDNP